MIQAKQTFIYVDSTKRVNKDGEQYLILNVMTKSTSKKKLYIFGTRFKL